MDNFGNLIGLPKDLKIWPKFKIRLKYKESLDLEHCSSPIWLVSFANTTHSNVVVSMENASNINI